MTRDEIIRMARLAGAMYDHMTWVERDLYPIFERFAALVAAAEREACAQVCKAEYAACWHQSAMAAAHAAQRIEQEIRARGE
jgi:hypothetical protein